MTTVAKAKTSVQVKVRQVADRITSTDVGAVVVVINKDLLPTTVPIGLNMPGRLKALASAIETLADELGPDAAKALKSATSQIGKVANKLVAAK